MRRWFYILLCASLAGCAALQADADVPAPVSYTSVDDTSQPAPRAAVELPASASAKTERRTTILVVADRVSAGDKTAAELPRTVAAYLQRGSVKASWVYIDRVSARAVDRADVIVYVTERAGPDRLRPAILTHARQIVLMHYDRNALRTLVVPCRGCVARITRHLQQGSTGS